MMNRARAFMMVFLLATSACSDGPTDPGSSAHGDLDVTADMELQVVGDIEVAEALMDDISLEMGVSMDGPPFGAGRECFREARRLLVDGDTDAARQRARECRTNLVRAMLERHGEAAVDELFARVEQLRERLGEAADEFARLGEMRTRIDGLLAEAGALRAGGDLVGAGERLVLALQLADRMRHRHPDFDIDPPAAARLSMARAGEAIRLAQRLIPEPTLRQETYLFRAVELRRRARFSFEHGWYRRAVAQAHRSQQLSLMAVLNGERPSVEEALRLLDLADEMIAQARAAIGDSPSEAQARVLELAVRLRDRGAEVVNEWQWRGVGLLWRAAVTAGVLIPDTDASG